MLARCLPCQVVCQHCKCASQALSHVLHGSPQGKHPQHRGISDPALLGRVERYFLEIRPIPRLRQRIACCIFSRSFAAAAERVRVAGWRR